MNRPGDSSGFFSKKRKERYAVFTGESSPEVYSQRRKAVVPGGHTPKPRQPTTLQRQADHYFELLQQRYESYEQRLPQWYAASSAYMIEIPTAKVRRINVEISDLSTRDRTHEKERMPRRSCYPPYRIFGSHVDKSLLQAIFSADSESAFPFQRSAAVTPRGMKDVKCHIGAGTLIQALVKLHFRQRVGDLRVPFSYSGGKLHIGSALKKKTCTATEKRHIFLRKIAQADQLDSERKAVHTEDIEGPRKELRVGERSFAVSFKHQKTFTIINDARTRAKNDRSPDDPTQFMLQPLDAPDLLALRIAAELYPSVQCLHVDSQSSAVLAEQIFTQIDQQMSFAEVFGFDPFQEATLRDDLYQRFSCVIDQVFRNCQHRGDGQYVLRMGFDSLCIWRSTEEKDADALHISTIPCSEVDKKDKTNFQYCHRDLSSFPFWTREGESKSLIVQRSGESLLVFDGDAPEMF